MLLQEPDFLLWLPLALRHYGYLKWDLTLLGGVSLPGFGASLETGAVTVEFWSWQDLQLSWSCFSGEGLFSLGEKEGPPSRRQRWWRALAAVRFSLFWDLSTFLPSLQLRFHCSYFLEILETRTKFSARVSVSPSLIFPLSSPLTPCLSAHPPSQFKLDFVTCNQRCLPFLPLNLDLALMESKWKLPVSSQWFLTSFPQEPHLEG